MARVRKTDRGFETVCIGEMFVAQSSSIGDYSDAIDRPGSSLLWIGRAHCNREDVAELIKHLQAWVETGSLSVAEEKES